MKKILALAIAAVMLVSVAGVFAMPVEIPETTMTARFTVVEDVVHSDDLFSMISEDGELIIFINEDVEVLFEDYVPLNDDWVEFTRDAREVLFGRTLAEVLNDRNLEITYNFIGMSIPANTTPTSVVILFETAVHLGYTGIMTLPEDIGDLHDGENWFDAWYHWGFNSREHMENQERSLDIVQQLQENFPLDENFNIVWPDFFGGLYLNDIGNLVIQVVNTDEAKSEAIAVFGAIVDLDEIIFEQVEFSEMYLMEILNSLFGLWDDPDCDIAQNVSGFGLDTMNNRVEFGLIVYNETEIARFRSEIFNSPAISFTQMDRAVFLDGGAWEEPEAAGDIRVIMDGEDLEFDVPAFIAYDRAMVPMRVIFEAFGMDVEWVNETQTVVAEKTDVHRTTITLQIGNDTMLVETRYLWIGLPDDEPRPAVYSSMREIELDAPPVIIDDRTFVPLRAISEALGAYVNWVDGVIIIETDAPQRFQFDPTVAWRLGLADELVPEYASHIEFIEFEEWNDEPHQRFAIVTYQFPMRDFRWIEIGYNDEAEDWRDWFYARSVLYELGDLEPRTPFVVTWMPWGTMPHRGISFIDPLGVRRYFTLNVNNAYPYDGPPSMFMLTEFGQ